MFEELLKEYQKLPIDSKRDKNIEEVKLVVAMLQLLCEKKQIKHDEIDIPELTNIEDENEYLDLMYIYIRITIIPSRPSDSLLNQSLDR